MYKGNDIILLYLKGCSYSAGRRKLQGSKGYKLKESKIKIIRDWFPTSLGSITIGGSAAIVGLDKMASLVASGSAAISSMMTGSVGVAPDAKAGAASTGVFGVATPSEGSL